MTAIIFTLLALGFIFQMSTIIKISDTNKRLQSQINRFDRVLKMSPLAEYSLLISSLDNRIYQLVREIDNLPINKAKQAKAKIEEARKIMEEISNE